MASDRSHGIIPGHYDHRRHHTPQRLTPLATPATRSFSLAGATGRPVSVQVTSAAGRRPVVVLAGSPPDMTERLARAGFAVVSVAPAADDLEVVLDAVGRGVLGVEADSYALVQPGPDGSIAVSRAVGGVRLSGAIVPGVDGLVQWLAKHHV